MRINLLSVKYIHKQVYSTSLAVVCMAECVQKSSLETSRSTLFREKGDVGGITV